MAGNGKTWRAFLSVTKGPGGTQVNAIDRSRQWPLVRPTRAPLCDDQGRSPQARPKGADPAIINDLPNETGVPNQTPDGTGTLHDNHATLTGSGPHGKL